jgi:hypothetical protein
MLHYELIFYSTEFCKIQSDIKNITENIKKIVWLENGEEKDTWEFLEELKTRTFLAKKKRHSQIPEKKNPNESYSDNLFVYNNMVFFLSQLLLHCTKLKGRKCKDES